MSAVVKAGRRDLIGASAALLLMGTAGRAKTAELDGDLIAACERFIFLEAEYGRLSEATDWHSKAALTPEMLALQSEFHAVTTERHELGDWLGHETPRSPEGVQARARAALAYIDPGCLNDMISKMQYNILLDLAGEG